MSARQTSPSFTRPGLAPGLLGAVALMAFVAVVDSDWFTIARYVISILALIQCVFALQAKQWWWLIGLLPIAVLWNPVFPIDLDTVVFQALHIVAAAVFVASGLLIKVAQPVERR
jgi:hypothetical protein